MKKLIVLFFLCVLGAQISYGVESSRRSGISIHFLPQNVASISGKKAGLSVDPAPYLKPNDNFPVFQKADELVEYVLNQEKQTLDNGVWIVISNPNAYSSDEMQLLENVKIACKKNSIQIFICRASELPNGWKKY